MAGDAQEQAETERNKLERATASKVTEPRTQGPELVKIKVQVSGQEQELQQVPTPTKIRQQ
jgi:hypothetical protein